MANATKKEQAPKRQRKNMNLSLSVFRQLEKEKMFLERRDKLQNMSWDVFFGLTMKELRSLRVGPMRVDQ
jgi:hypothetical protein